MLAIEINNASLQTTKRPIPTPLTTEVLIKVTAAGINRPDIMQRKGLYPPPKGASDIPGLEVSGTVVKTGPLVKHIKKGDKVCALVTGGGMLNTVQRMLNYVSPFLSTLTLFKQPLYPKHSSLFGAIFLIVPS